MLEPALPDDEVARIASLQSLRILDTEPEERFDRVTRLAKKLFKVSISLVSLVDTNRQWFKSSAGLKARETPRNISFCGHAIHNKHTFIVEDTLLDKRFFDNPLVTEEPYIRFYAGQPITAPNGDTIGTLCIIDSKPKKLTPDDISSLSDLAALVTDEFISLQLATMDDLTNITNRRGFIRLAQHSVDSCARQKSSCHLAYFDLNHFKEINDNYGHNAGDKVLKLFAEEMMNTFRVSDICARIGGDEFVALLTNTELDTVEDAIKRFAKNLLLTSKVLKLPYEISFAYGIASYNIEKHKHIEQMLMQADKAMYEDKRRE